MRAVRQEVIGKDGRVGLREAIESGFPVVDVWHPWGTTLGTVEDDCDRRWPGARFSTEGRPRNAGDHIARMRCTSVLGIPALTITVYAPMRVRPVVWVRYELAAGHGLEGAAGLASMRRQFDDALELLPPGAAGIGPPPLDGCRADWTIGSVNVHLLTLAKPQSDRNRSYSGSLHIVHDQVALLAPFAAAKRAATHEWAHTPGKVELIPVRGLVEMSDESLESTLAVHDHYYPTPRWVASHISAGLVAIWDHPASRTWGIANSRATSVMANGALPEPPFVHLRARPSRGRGWSSLAGQASVPGESGLDRLAERIVARGLPVRVQTFPDE